MRIAAPIGSWALERTTRALQRALERLSSGQRVISPRDGAADYSQSIRYESDVRGYGRALLNINSAVSQLQIRDSALQTQMDLTQRMRELAVQAANQTLSPTDRVNLNTEFQSLLSEFERLATESETLGIQVGPQADNRISTTYSGSSANETIRENYWLDTYSLQETSASLGQITRDSYFEDINGDGDKDLIYVTRNALVTRLGNGDGTFQANQSYDFGVSTFNSSPSTSVIDIDADGDLDFVGVGSAANALIVRLNNGSGIFSVAMTTTGIGSAPSSLAVADINGDGDLDIAYGLASAGGGIVTRFGLGNGAFSSPTTISFGGSALMVNVRMADFDGDGKIDLAAIDNAADQFVILKGDGAGGFTTHQTIANPYVGTDLMRLDVGDFNGDGEIDILTSLFGGKFTIWANDGSGTFSASTCFNGESSLSGRIIDVFDFDGDGDLDFGATGDISNVYVQYYNDGDGNFTSRGTLSTGTNDANAHIARDFNGDGFVDLFITDLVALNSNIYFAQTSDRRAQNFDLTTATRAAKTLDVLDRTLEELTSRRSEVGAVMSRLEFTSASALIAQDNLSEAKSKLVDADIALETAELVRLQILQQAQMSVLAQGNVSMRIVLQLLEF